MLQTPADKGPEFRPLVQKNKLATLLGAENNMNKILHVRVRHALLFLTAVVAPPALLKSNSPPHNLHQPLYKIRFFVLRFFFVASFRKIGYTKKTGRARVTSTDGP